jgi:hypothetical protein
MDLCCTPLLSNRRLVVCPKDLYDHDGGAAAERIIGHLRTVVGRRMRTAKVLVQNNPCAEFV